MAFPVKQATRNARLVKIVTSEKCMYKTKWLMEVGAPIVVQGFRRNEFERRFRI